MAFVTPEKLPILALVGNGGVGKSSYLEMMSNGNFQKRYLMTQEPIDVSITTQGYQLILRDYPGQEHHRALRQSTYPQVDGFMIFASTSRLSIQALPNWIDEIRQISTAPIVIVITNADVEVKENLIKKALVNHKSIGIYHISNKYLEGDRIICDPLHYPIIDLLS